MSKKKRITVAEFIAQQVALTDKTQKEIAAAVGYDRPNFITMIKQGQSKLPISKAVPLANDPPRLPRRLVGLSHAVTTDPVDCE